MNVLKKILKKIFPNFYSYWAILLTIIFIVSDVAMHKGFFSILFILPIAILNAENGWNKYRAEFFEYILKNKEKELFFEEKEKDC